MYHGFVHIYQADWSQKQARLRIAAMEAAGFSPENPDTGKIITGDFDDQNEPIAKQRDQLIQGLALTDRDRQSFTYWLGTRSSTFCTIRRVSPSVVVEEFNLVAFSGPEPAPAFGSFKPEMSQDQVVQLLLDQMHQIGPSVVGFIADRWGSSLEIDIDDIVLGGPTPVTIMPLLLILHPEVADRHPELADQGRRQYGRLSSFDPTGILDRM